MEHAAVPAVGGMTSAAQEVLKCLFFHGPIQDGDIPSKIGRGDLVTAGYVERWNGWQWLTKDGIMLAIETFKLDRAKEKWQRERSQAVHQSRHRAGDPL